MTRAAEPRSRANDAGRIAVVAGGGALPLAVARTLVHQGRDPLVLLVEGEADAADYAGLPYETMRIEDAGPALARLQADKVSTLVLAGNIERRPRLRAMKWNLTLLAMLPRVAAMLLRGDDGLLRGVIRIVEEKGIRVAGAHEIVPNLLAPSGNLTRAQPSARDLRDIDAASEAALAIGRLDIGQGAIAIGGRAVALEGIEGTDGLIERTGAMRGHGRLAGKAGGVLVKHCKPQQERRADLPAIGPDTVDAAHKAGLAGIAVDAGRSFILDFEATIARADALGLFVVGLADAGEGP